MKKTKKYDRFNFLEGNRNIYPAHLRKLIKSISEDNRLKENPIIVSKNLSVIDGQHRLKAAEALGVSVYYVIADDASIETVIRMQTQKSWSAKDFIKSHMKYGSGDYEILWDFIDYYHLPINVSMNLLSGGKAKETGGSLTTKLRDGSFKVTSLKQAEEFAEKYNDIYNRIKKPFARNRDFIIALKTIMKSDNYRHETMLRKLDVYSSRLTNTPSYLEYARQLEEIYNTKSRGNKVRLF
jgi:hypothetical protein